ncbi:MAG: hypothetical protein M1817_000353 [Caeruleum heppii]|nr:MAG: hypothetical protein M1817_000353 [Caeruleum heppii]
MSKPPIDGYVDPNIPNPNGEGDAPIIIYGYTPSLVLAVLGIVLFALSSLLHAYQVFRYRTWWFSAVAVGCLGEIVGYVFRLRSTKNPYAVISFVVQYFFLVVMPCLLAASVYAILGKLIRRLGRQYSVLGPRPVIWIFVAFDLVCTAVQVVGAAKIGVAQSNRQDPTTANNILLVGLAVQVFSFTCFLALYLAFLVRARKVIGALWPFILSLTVAILLLFLRTCFRCAETAQGLGGYLSSREVFFGCLEFAPVVVAVFLLNGWHPGHWLSSRKQSTSRHPEMLDA